MDEEPNDSALSLAGYVANGLLMIAGIIAARIYVPDWMLPLLIGFAAGVWFYSFTIRIRYGRWF